MNGRLRLRNMACGALCLHFALLALASTNYTLISWMWGDAAWTFNYYQYAYRNGFGYQYVSEYGLLVVGTYVLAHSIGLIGYFAANRLLSPGWTRIAIVFCLAGLVSFSIELTHWFRYHHFSWIASVPLLGLVLACVTIARLAIFQADKVPDKSGSKSDLAQVATP